GSSVQQNRIAEWRGFGDKRRRTASSDSIPEGRSDGQRRKGGTMANFNKSLLLGNPARDPEMKCLPSGTPVTEFGIAINRKWMDQATNQPREAVTYVDCKVMGRQAEVLSQHVRKGSPLFVEGRLDYRQWEGPDGAKRS